MNKRTPQIFLLIALAILAGIVLMERKHFAPTRRLNLLIVSVCSLRAANLGIYGYARDTTPALTALAKEAFVFDSAFNDKSWSNLSGFLRDLSADYLASNGYQGIGNWTEHDLQRQSLQDKKPVSYYFRLPQEPKENRDYLFVNDFPNIKNRILSSASKPFLLEIHSKFIHAPYNDVALPEKNEFMRKFLSENSRSLLEQYASFPEKFVEKVGLYLMLGQGQYPKMVKVVESNPRIVAAKRSNQFSTSNRRVTWMGWMTDEGILNTWEKSKGFLDDLQLLKDLYDSRLFFHDHEIQPILNLYGNQELLENTVIIFTGDHGEEFLDHGKLLHGNQVYDESIRFPLVIKFPGQKVGRRIASQFYQGDLLPIIKQIIEGKINQENFEQYLAKHPKKILFARNCNGTKRSARLENHWKLIFDDVTNEKELYDLSQDPKEKNNIYGSNPQIEALLEEQLTTYDINSGNQMIGDCVKE